MKTPSFLVAVLMAGCSTVDSSSLIGHVVLDQHHTMTLAYWKPVEAEVASAVSALTAEFSRARRSNSGRLPHPLSEYVITCHGDEISGKRVMIIRGFHKSQKTLGELQAFNAESTGIVHQVSGGGALYFTFLYDPAVSRGVQFSIHAPK